MSLDLTVPGASPLLPGGSHPTDKLPKRHEAKGPVAFYENTLLLQPHKNQLRQCCATL